MTVHVSDDDSKGSRREAQLVEIEKRLATARDHEDDRQDVLELIFRRFYYSVVYFFQNRKLSPQDSEDLAQETFIKVFKSLNEFRGDASISTWVFRIAMNAFLNRLRDSSAQKRGAPEVPLEDEVEHLPEPSSAGSDPESLGRLLKEEELNVLRRALETLPPQQKRCVELRIYADLKYREIATLMQVSIETVKAHLFQARQHLRQAVGEYFDIDL